ncbi:cation diffusion facilitator family transporter [Syntrophus gentianae]|uniref:Cation diffusion facilitator family transporter n=1 Tax=Syntrophus gentianae TaxID=43775 RepID=A0A1H8A3M3_9BACT|nr:cation diffusion facilitator family transporter [Syntrophus gentianae]SEM64147.1 cation diffusion facilitator family transporter [Syntrophus gentianae]
MDRTERFGMADRIITIGFLINAVLMVMKLLAGYFGSSEAVLADGMESACDFAAMLVTMIALKIGRKPFDEDHPYGHGKAESLSAMLVSLGIFATGGVILFNAGRTILAGTCLKPHGIAVVAALVTILAKETLFRYTRRIAQKLESPAVDSIAKDHRKDALSSVATLIGVGGAYWGLSVMDPLAAGLTAFFIFYIGWETFHNAAHDLMDGQPPREIIGDIKAIIDKIPQVECVHEVRCRRSGQYLIVNIKLEMDPQMTVKQSHEVTVIIKKCLFEEFPNVGDVMIHVNPHEPDAEHHDLIRL